jgi:hypothetical protein
VPGHGGIPGNAKANELATQGAALLLLSPEPTLGIGRCSAREAVKNWIEIQHYIAWENLSGHRHDELFVSGPCNKRAEDLFKLSRYQLRTVVAFLTGHASVKKHLNIMYSKTPIYCCRI